MKCTNSAKSRMDANMQLTINSFRPLFPDKIFSPTLPWQLSHSLTFAGFPDKWSPCMWPSPLTSWPPWPARQRHKIKSKTNQDMHRQPKGAYHENDIDVFLTFNDVMNLTAEVDGRNHIILPLAQKSRVWDSEIQVCCTGENFRYRNAV